ncbi:PIR Superfamily Protein [Plasmodium ovale wallikeri]|uniref:PIR Superfamily Protein n=1 Tax=Plasmodium ovale wallikeri TaxID=864142 RepID=A0A1A8Z7R3_PLAOA|nr:PIR Superfamily Protein [Plasmodium ovale wallikeri]
MSESGSQGCISEDVDLPEVKFDKEFTEAIDLKLFEKSAFQDEIIDIDAWCIKFCLTLQSYYNEKSKEWPEDTHEKRCRDLNYYVTYVFDLITLIETSDGKKKKSKVPESYINSLKQSVNKVFSGTNYFKCNRDESNYIGVMSTRKDLDDFCENRNYLSKQMNGENINCDRLVSYVNETYKCFFDDKKCIFEDNTDGTKLLEISDTCTLYNIPKTFSYPNCPQHKIPYRIQSIPYCPKGYMSIYDHISEFIYEYAFYIPYLPEILEYGFYSVVTVFGIVLLSSILFRCISLGKFFRNKKNSQKTQKMIDEYTSELLVNSTYYEPLYTQNRKYGLSYQQLKDSLEDDNEEYYSQREKR